MRQYVTTARGVPSLVHRCVRRNAPLHVHSWSMRNGLVPPAFPQTPRPFDPPAQATGVGMQHGTEAPPRDSGAFGVANHLQALDPPWPVQQGLGLSAATTRPQSQGLWPLDVQAEGQGFWGGGVDTALCLDSPHEQKAPPKVLLRLTRRPGR